jgi:hypothetical protein
MLTMKEAAPQNDMELEEKTKKWYQNVLSFLQSDGFEVRMADAAFLRQTIRQILHDNIRADFLMAYPEIIERFCWQIYGINVSDYFENNDSEKAKTDLYEHLRKQADMNWN